MKRAFISRAAALSVIVSASMGTALATPTYNIQNVQFPTDLAFTQLLGINNAGTIAGFHGAVVTQGFTLTLPHTFTSQNFPGSVTSLATAINGAGSTAGIYQDGGGTTHGYTQMGGLFSTVDQPGTVFNQALGINDSNTTVGYFAADKAGQTGQSAYRQSGGVFTNLNALLPTNQNSQAVGINNAGNIVGFYMPAATTSIGFLEVGGAISMLDPFGSAFTQALGISNTGEIVGIYADAGGVQHGYTEVGGVFSSFDPIGSITTTVNGVNDRGQFVGFYTDATNNVIGFAATPLPEPGSFALVSAGLLGLTGIYRRRGRRLATKLKDVVALRV